MNKQTQMYVGVGVVAIAGYFIWKSTQTKKGFMNLTAKAALSPGCPCKEVSSTITVNGVEWNVCAGVGGDGQHDKMCRKGAGPVKDKSFVGDNSKVFKGDNFVGDNSRVFKGDM